MHEFDQAINTLRAGNCTAHRELSRAEAAALGQLYGAYAGLVIAVARRIVGDATEAEDVAHDVFSALPRAIARYRDGAFHGWLIRVATRVALSRMRRSRARREDPYADYEICDWLHAVDESDTGASLNYESLHRLVRTLPESLRQVTMLRFFLGLSHHEIAAKLDITATASEIRLCRALKRLRVGLREEVDPPRDAARIA